MRSIPAKIIKKQINVFMITYDGFNILDVAGPVQVFTEANDIQSNSTIEYKVSVVSKVGGLVESNSGVCLNTAKLSQLPVGENTLLVAGGSGVHKVIKDFEFITWFTETVFPGSHRIGSVCTGSFILAETGILNGKRAVTHWRAVEQFQREYPAVTVECDPIYINDKGVWTSAGISAGIDLALAIVAEDLGHQASLETARELVVYLKRSGGQSQFSTPLYNQTRDKLGLFTELHHWIQKNLNSDLSIDRLADQMNMSQRTFYRLYKRTIGITPAKSIEKIRIESTKGKLENSVLSTQIIAKTCGFGNEGRFRRAFVNQVGITPQEYRTRFRLN